jgi:chromosome segregation ATPase
MAHRMQLREDTLSNLKTEISALKKQSQKEISALKKQVGDLNNVIQQMRATNDTKDETIASLRDDFRELRRRFRLSDKKNDDLLEQYDAVNAENASLKALNEIRASTTRAIRDMIQQRDDTLRYYKNNIKEFKRLGQLFDANGNVLLSNRGGGANGNVLLSNRGGSNTSKQLLQD